MREIKCTSLNEELKNSNSLDISKTKEIKILKFLNKEYHISEKLGRTNTLTNYTEYGIIDNWGE